MYMANQLDGKIFKDPSLLPAKGAYSQFVQTKASVAVLAANCMQVCLGIPVPTADTCCMQTLIVQSPLCCRSPLMAERIG
jgi:hypothetical protein